MARLLQGGPKDVSCPLPWSLKTLPSFQKWGRDLYQGTSVGLGEDNSRRLVLRDILGGGSPKGVEEDASPYAVLWLVVVGAVMWGGLEGLGEDISLLSHPRGHSASPGLCLRDRWWFLSRADSGTFSWQTWETPYNSLHWSRVSFSLWPIFSTIFYFMLQQIMIILWYIWKLI